MSRVTESGVGRGPVFAPSPASWIRTLIMSTGWTTVVAVMPASPPLTNGSTARTNGVCRKSDVVFFGFSVADLSAAGVSAIVSLVAVAAASVLRLAAFAIAVELGNGADIFTKRLFSGELEKVMYIFI